MNKDQFAYLNESIVSLEVQRDNLLKLPATERDAFGKRETELKAELADMEEECLKLKDLHRDYPVEFSRLREEISKLKALIAEWEKIHSEIQQRYVNLISDRDRWRTLCEGLAEYVNHCNNCILTFWACGEPTPDGGYRNMYKGKWYQSKPIDETPKCDCGADDAYIAYDKAVQGKHG